MRHAGAIMGLYQAATAGIPDALDSADRGVGWARDRLVDHDGWTALADGTTAPVGGAALLAAGLVERRLLTGDTRDDELMRALGRFMTAMTLPDGAVISHYDLTTMAPIADSRSKYYTGEAYWALARLHRLFPDDGFGAGGRSHRQLPGHPAATTSRTTGRRFPTTGPPTGWPRRCSSPSAIAATR